MLAITHEIINNMLDEYLPDQLSNAAHQYLMNIITGDLLVDPEDPMPDVAIQYNLQLTHEIINDMLKECTPYNVSVEAMIYLHRHFYSPRCMLTTMQQNWWKIHDMPRRIAAGQLISAASHASDLELRKCYQQYIDLLTPQEIAATGW